MALFRWGVNVDPFAGLRFLQRELDRLVDLPGWFSDSQAVGGGNYPPVNVYNGQSEIIVLAELPGVQTKDLELSITAETLVLKGQKAATIGEDEVRYHRRERGSGQFNRTIILPDKVDADKVSAKLANGVLTITLPKSEWARPKQIAVTT